MSKRYNILPGKLAPLCQVQEKLRAYENSQYVFGVVVSLRVTVI